MARKILVVDDEQVNRRMLYEILCDEYEIIEAENGQEAVSVMYRENSNLSAVLLDIYMPVMDGFEVLDKRRSDSVLARIPTIVVTVSDNKDTEVKAIAAGANDFIIKPYTPQIILHCLKNNIEKNENASFLDVLKYDKLTGIYKRETFLEAASGMIHTHEPARYILSCFDIDSFKVINDQYGVDTGDKVLKHIANILRSCVSKTEGICCRITADDFAVLYPAEYAESDVILNAHRLATEPECINRKIKIRIGRYLVDDLSIAVSAMFDRAMMAAESIKGRYDTYIAEYNDSLRSTLLHEQQIVYRMHEALQNGEFEPWLQPQYNHSTGAMVGAEALVRWKKDGMFISPAEFIPVFERNGFIYEMDQHIWERICILLRRWLDEGKNPLPISVNISRCDFLHKHFINVFTGIVNKYDIPYNLIRIEVTESAFADSTNQIIKKVVQLINLGFTIEIDDFGSGYSSLNTLKDVPATILKLDMRFFEDTDNSQRSGNIIESVVRMAKWLGMAVIAEGVEDKEQADYLRSIGCCYIQGFFYAKPMPVAEYERQLFNSETEHELSALKTIEELNNNEFWNPKSMETLIFNSYVGGACIFEYSGGRTELLRANERYAQELGYFSKCGSMLSEDILSLYLDDENYGILILNIENAIKEKHESSCEVTLADDEGHCEYIRTTVRVIAKTDERYLLYCVIVNMTEQRLAEKRRADAEKRETDSAQLLEIILGNINGGVSALLVDNDGKSSILFCNEKYYSLYGYTKKMVDEEKPDVLSLIIPEDRDMVTKKINLLTQTGTPVTIDYRCRKRDGSIVYLRANASLMHMEQFGQDVITSVLTDITEEKRVTNQLMLLTNNIPGGLAKYRIENGKMHTLYLSDGVYKVSGYTKEEYDAISGGNALFAVFSEDIELLYDTLNSTLSDDSPIDCTFRIHHKSNEMRWINLRGSISERRDSCIIVDTVFFDITEKMLAEEQISLNRRNMELTNRLITDSSSAVYVCDAENYELLYINRKCAMMCGKSVEEAKGLTCYRFLKGLDKPCKPCYMEFVNDKEYTEKEYSSGASGKHYMTRGKFIDWYDRRALVEYLSDETERIKAQRGMQDLINGIPCGIGIYNYYYDGRIEVVYINDGYYSVIGADRSDRQGYAGFSVTDAIHQDDVKLMGQVVSRAVRENTIINVDIRVMSGSGEYKWLNIKGNIASREDDKAVVYAVYSDIDNEKKHHLQLEASKRVLETANKEGRIGLWVLDLESRQISNDISGDNPYGFNPVIENAPQSFIDDGIVYEDDKQKFIEMYDRLYSGENRSECIVRLLNKLTKRFVWQHIIYTRTDDLYYARKSAVGICADVDNEYEMRLQYEHEVHMRQEILRDSLIYYQLNLSTGIIESYGTNVNDIPSMAVMKEVSDGTRGEILENIAPEHRDIVKNTLFTNALLEAYRRKERSISLEYRRKVNKTDYHWVLATVKITQRPDTNEIIAFLSTKDIDTEKKNKTALDSVIDEEIQTVSIINVNNGIERLINVSKSYDNTMLNRTFVHDEKLRELVEKDFRGDEKEKCLDVLLLNNLKRTLDSEGSVADMFRVWRSDGSIRRKRIFAFYLDDTHEDIVISDRDITLAFEAEEKQRQKLQDAFDAANKANRAKSEFLSRMSHSMRTPLNAVIGMVGLAKDEKISDAALRYLNDIDSAGHLLLVLINDILDVENINKGNFTLKREKFCAEEFISCINAVMKPMLDSKGIRFIAELNSETEFIITDSVRFTQVFFSLLANTAKVTDAGDTIELTSLKIPDRNGLYGIRYFIKRIRCKTVGNIDFVNGTDDIYAEEFNSADDLRSDINLVEKLIIAMGGTLSVYTDESDECRYTVDFFAETVPTAVASRKKGNDRHCLCGKRMLLVDDNRMNILVAQRLLESQGCIVVTAENGKEGAEKFIQSDAGFFAAVLMDIRMPVMNGIDATKAIRTSCHRDAVSIPIIAMTAEARNEDEKEWTSAGINAQLYKPIEPELLFKTLTRLTEEN